MTAYPPTSHPATHPTVLKAFRSLDETGVPWVLLRGEDDLARPSGDVDILVDRGMLPVLDELMGRIGLFRVQATGHGSHRFYFGYIDVDELWLKLDIVSDISFGRYQQWRTPLGAGCLERRVRQGEFWLPAPDDKAWLQLLHLVLDKGEIKPERTDVALAAAAAASEHDRIAAYLDLRSGDGTAAQLLELVRTKNFDEVRILAGQLRSAWTRTRPVGTRVQGYGNRGQRLRTPRLPGRGPVVGVMAPDGAGKTTLLHGLRADFPLPTAYVYMGMWGAGPWDHLLQRVPGGRTAKKMFRLLKGGAAARYHSLRGRVVLMDRVAYDALLPAMAGSSPTPSWSNSLAVRLGPSPDILLVLDAPGEVMFARKGEHTVELLEHWRQAYLQLATRLPGARVIDAGLPQEQVRRLATETVWNSIAARAPLAPEADAEDSSGLALHQWRLLDWRFLIPLLQPSRLGYGGAIGRDLMSALHLLDPAAAPVRPRPSSAGADGPAGEGFDVVLLREPGTEEFVDAAAAVQPGGWVCAQVKRTLRGRRPHTVAGWKRMFVRHGFEDVSVHWNVPGLDNPARLVPVSSAAAVLGTLSLHKGVRFGLLKALAGRLALILHLFDVAIPAGTVTGRRRRED
ncbi:hypothetical protein [Arthrobacter sp. B3I4]|uniref:dTMP kinase n=1 Tax=Arthrobacter sp. B3I4 TaxID=3042267 RepID=UPI0027808E0E|nr:hypothetical protein [Arthrobacter sp. B3I4]MDQ0755124.1 thymidylate kinase [Arthrobacter sp. B3I4]